jgi:hypothetical protein
MRTVIVIICVIVVGGAVYYFGGKAEVKGVVTFLFNDNIGNKPDVGATVFLLEEDDELQKAYRAYKDFRFQQTLAMIKGEWKSNEPRPKEDSVFNDLLRKSIRLESLQETVADGDGNFSFKVNPGEYIVVVRSANRKAITSSEILGKVSCDWVSVGWGETKDQSINFDAW